MVTLASNNSASRKQSNTRTPSKSEIEISESRYNDLRFNLASNLQSTLELEATLNTFFDHASAVVNCSGIRYSNTTFDVSLDFGNPSRHSALYNVSSGTDRLGELSFMRDNKFAEAELAVLEMLIGVLFYPLRNALKYRQAIENSFIDKLTGVSNRFALDLNISREIKLSQRHQKALSVLLIDVDHFKKVNDSHGHLSGDYALKEIARITRQTLRETDQVFRYGGEEFIALLNETDMESARLSAERIRENIANTTIKGNSAKFNTSVSIGISSLAMSDDFESLFDRADKALYDAKREGRNKVACSTSDKNNEIKKIA